MTDYGNTTYVTRFVGTLPNTLGTKQGDPFTNSRPQLFDNQEPPRPIAGYAELDAKWIRYEPDPESEALIFAGVNVRTQMAEITNDGVKEVVGFYQQLPLPALPGDVVNRAIYGACSMNHGDNNAANNVGNFGGIMLADGDLATSPETTQIWIAGTYIVRAADFSGQVIMQALPSVGQFVTFDALPVQAVLSTFPVPAFARIRTRQRCTAPATFTSEAAIDLSSNGSEWSTVAILPTLSALRKSFGIGVWANEGFTSTLHMQNVEVVDQDFDDPSSKCGDTLRLGPV